MSSPKLAEWISTIHKTRMTNRESEKDKSHLIGTLQKIFPTIMDRILADKVHGIALFGYDHLDRNSSEDIKTHVVCHDKHMSDVLALLNSDAYSNYTASQREMIIRNVKDTNDLFFIIARFEDKIDRLYVLHINQKSSFVLMSI